YTLPLHDALPICSVREHRVVAGPAQLLDNRIADVEGDGATHRGGALTRRHAWGAAIEREPEGRIERDRRLIQRELADDNRVGPSHRGGLLLGTGRRAKTKEGGYTRSELQAHRVPPTTGDVKPV